MLLKEICLIVIIILITNEKCYGEFKLTKSLKYETVQCRNETNSFSSSKNQNSQKRKILKIGFLHHHLRMSKVGGAFRYALDVSKGCIDPPKHGIVNEKRNPLTNIRDDNFEIRIYPESFEKVRLPMVMEKVSKIVRSNVSSLFGLEVFCNYAAAQLGAFNITMIAHSCREPNILDKLMFPTLARTYPHSKISKFILSFLKYFQWNKFVLFYVNSQNWINTAVELKKNMKQSGMTITNEFALRSLTTGSDSIPKETIQEEYRKAIHKSYVTGRIYVFLGSHVDLDELCIIMRNNMPYPPSEYVIIGLMDKFLERTKELLPGYYCLKTSTFLITVKPPPNKDIYQDFAKHVIKYGGSNETSFEKAIYFNNTFKFDLPWESHIVDLPAAYLYDAVMVYLKAVNDLIDKNLDFNNGINVLNSIKNTTFPSVLGFNIHIDETGDSEGNFTVSTYLNILSKEEFLTTVATFWENVDMPILNVIRSINWINGKPPLSEPICGFHNDKCPFDWITFSIVASIILIVLMSGIFGLKHYLYEQKLARLLWKVNFDNIVILNETQAPQRSKSKKKSVNHWSFLLNEEDSSESLPTRNEASYTRRGLYRGHDVSIKYLRKKHVELTRSVRKEFQQIKELNHENLNSFIGACVDPPNICLLTVYCERGSLRDILSNEEIPLDCRFIASFLYDIIKGMNYLHESSIGYHGNLKPTKCLIDRRWVLQISGFGLRQLRQGELQADNIDYSKLLWRAPEHLRSEGPHSISGSSKGDIYSFGFILYELLINKGPWNDNMGGKTAREIVELVKNKPIGETHRPPLNPDIDQEIAFQCIRDCWSEDPEKRPDFKLIRIRLKPMLPRHSNIFDNMLAIMEQYSTNLEALVDERTQQLTEEKKKIENLLLRMLPSSIFKSITEQLKTGQHVVPEQYESVTIYFSDIVGFTELSAQSTPMEVVQLLNDLYTLFDSIIGEYDVYKIETIGDAYMVVSGLPERNGDYHAGEIASMSLHLLKAIIRLKVCCKPSENLFLRIGIHSGPCVAGVVGLKMPRYCLFGDTVNTASRMESTGVALKIHLSSATNQILDRLGGYHVEERGMIDVKGKGEMLTYFLLSEDKDVRKQRLHARQCFQTTNQTEPETETLLSNNQFSQSMNSCSQFDNKLLKSGQYASIPFILIDGNADADNCRSSTIDAQLNNLKPTTDEMTDFIRKVSNTSKKSVLSQSQDSLNGVLSMTYFDKHSFTQPNKKTYDCKNADESDETRVLIDSTTTMC